MIFFNMALLKKLLWILFFFVATFCWVVLFEHGAGDFLPGAQMEFEKLLTLFGMGGET